MTTAYKETLAITARENRKHLTEVFAGQALSLLIIGLCLYNAAHTGLHNLIYIPAVIISAVYAYRLLMTNMLTDTDLEEAELVQELYDRSCQNKSLRGAGI